MSDRKLLTEWMAFDYSSDTIKENRELNNGKIVMKGILQKSDTLNQNGRVYPREILNNLFSKYDIISTGQFLSDNRN